MSGFSAIADGRVDTEGRGGCDGRAVFYDQRELNERKRIVVGVNDFTQEDEVEPPTLKIDSALERKQIDRLAATRASRDAAAVEEAR